MDATLVHIRTCEWHILPFLRVTFSFGFSRRLGFQGPAPSPVPIPALAGLSVMSSEFPDPFT